MKKTMELGILGVKRTFQGFDRMLKCHGEALPTGSVAVDSDCKMHQEKRMLLGTWYHFRF